MSVEKREVGNETDAGTLATIENLAANTGQAAADVKATLSHLQKTAGLTAEQLHAVAKAAEQLSREDAPEVTKAQRRHDASVASVNQLMRVIWSYKIVPLVMPREVRVVTWLMTRIGPTYGRR